MVDNLSKNQREVGRVISVSNFRLTVLLDSDVKSQVRAFAQQVSLITQIGAYLLFPTAPGENAVGMITGASEDEAFEPDDDSVMRLQLVRARRVLRVNLLGQLLETRPFQAGISTYPTLETAALLPTEEQLRRILEFVPARGDDRDTALAVGSSQLYSRQNVTVSFNDFLGRSLGIVGNSGSGKSCSLASIVQRSLTMNSSHAALAKYIVLDVNGEYLPALTAFQPTERQSNTAYVNGKPLVLPLWMLKLQEFIEFFEASSASQVPVLERVITSAREDSLDETGGTRAARDSIRRIDSALNYLQTISLLTDTPTEKWLGKKARDLLDHTSAATAEISKTKDVEIPQEITRFATNLPKLKQGIEDHNIPIASVTALQAVIASTCEKLEVLRNVLMTKGGIREITADTPVPFAAPRLLEDALFYSVISRFRGQERIQEYVATLRLRIHRQLSDKRWSVFTADSDISVLQDVVKSIVGSEAERVVVIDCSMLAHDVLPFFCAVVGRILLELRSHSSPRSRTTQPFVVVLEEAHNYLKPRRDDELFGVRLSRASFERIAKEGRKYGLSLVIASQRPSDVSPTVLSQCANFLVHRIQNPEDIEYFKKILPTGSRELLEQLPILAPGDGILVGSALNVPARVRIPLPKPQPDSDTPRPWFAWGKAQPEFDTRSSASNWLNDTPIQLAEGLSETAPDVERRPEDGSPETKTTPRKRVLKP